MESIEGTVEGGMALRSATQESLVLSSEQNLNRMLLDRIDHLTDELERVKQQLRDLLPADLPNYIYVPDKYERSKELFVRFFVKDGSNICDFIKEHPKVSATCSSVSKDIDVFRLELDVMKIPLGGMRYRHVPAPRPRPPKRVLVYDTNFNDNKYGSLSNHEFDIYQGIIELKESCVVSSFAKEVLEKIQPYLYEVDNEEKHVIVPIRTFEDMIYYEYCMYATQTKQKPNQLNSIELQWGDGTKRYSKYAWTKGKSHEDHWWHFYSMHRKRLESMPEFFVYTPVEMGL
jgi:hypothetical protein